MNSCMDVLLIFLILIECFLPLPYPLLLFCSWHIYGCDFTVDVWVVVSGYIFKLPNIVFERLKCITQFQDDLV